MGLDSQAIQKGDHEVNKTMHDSMNGPPKLRAMLLLALVVSTSTIFALAPTALAATAPSVPSSVSAVGRCEVIYVSWTAPADGGSPILNYNVYRATISSGPYTLIATSTSTAWADRPLPEGTGMWYQISATNSVGEGSVSASTYGETFPPASQVQNVQAVAGPNQGEATITWDLPAHGHEVNVYRATSPTGPFTRVGSRFASDQTYTDSGLSSGTTFYYHLTAFHSAWAGNCQESPPSLIASATTFSVPSPPQNLQAVRAISLANALTWQAPIATGDPSAKIAYYDVYRGECSGCALGQTPARVIPAAPGTEPPTAYLDTFLPTTTTTYYYQVTASNTLGRVSDPSNEAVAAPLSRPTAPPESEGYSRHVLVNENKQSVGAVAPGATVATLVVRDGSDNDVCFDVKLTFPGSTQNVACIGKNFLGSLESAIPRGDTPVGTEGGLLAAAAVSVAADYQWDEAHRQANKAVLLGGLVTAYAPVTPGDYAWFLGPGGQGAALAITLSVYNNDQLVSQTPLVFPYLGQALAAAAASGGV